MSARQGNPPLADDRLHALGETLQIRRQAGDPGRAVRRLGLGTQRDILTQRIGEEKRILGHIADRRAQAHKRNFFDRHPVDQHLPRASPNQAGHQPGDRRLARADPANHRQRTAGRHANINIAQHWLVLVGEIGVAKFYLTANRCGLPHQSLPHLRLDGEDFLQPTERSSATLIFVDDPPQEHHWHAQPGQIGIERNKGTQTQPPVDDPQSAQPQNYHHRHAIE